MASATKWRTAYKRYRCSDSPSPNGWHEIRPGDRYVLATVFPGDAYDRITQFRYCAVCAVVYQEVLPDPLEKR